MAFRTSRIAAVSLLLGVLACSKTEEPSPGGAEPSPATPTAQAEPLAPPAPPTAPPGSKVFFVEPTDGAEIKGPLVDGKVPVHVKMGVEGIDLVAAGEQKQGSGHHHIIVDGELVAMGTPVPKDETHLHYGKAQSEADIALTPGEHTLTMQFADGAHMSYGPQLSQSIKVKVAVDPKAPAPAMAAAPAAAPAAEAPKPAK
jgi:hypothetical protein